MNNFSIENSVRCRNIQSQLSDFVDGSLSARQALEVEGHLTGCASCAEAARQMQATVNLLQTAPRLDTSDDFMARLHARLDLVEPEAVRPLSAIETIREWGAAVIEPLRRWKVPAVSMGFAVAGLALLAVFNPLAPGVTVRPGSTKPIAAETLHYNVALTASNPFDDPAAANLEAANAEKGAGTVADNAPGTD